MIEVEVVMGRGDREMSRVTDDLIRTQNEAVVRGKQELAKSMTIIKSRKLALHKIQEVEMGEDVIFDSTRLEIGGTHRVAAMSLDITPEAVLQTITVERYGSTP